MGGKSLIGDGLLAKLINPDEVESVAGKKGIVILDGDDVSAIIPGAIPSTLPYWHKFEGAVAPEVGPTTTFVGSPSFEAAKFNNGIKVTTGNYPTFNTGVGTPAWYDHREGCIEIWIKPVGFSITNGTPSDAIAHRLISWEGSGNNGHDIYINPAGTPFHWIANAGGSTTEWQFVPTGFTLVDGQLGHIALTWNSDAGTKKRRLFFNDVEIGDENTGWNPAEKITNGVVRIGQDTVGTGAGDIVFDNIKMWDYQKLDFSDRNTEGYDTSTDVQAYLDTLKTDVDLNNAHRAVAAGNPHQVTLEEARSEDNQLAGEIDANNNKITDLGHPTNPHDVVDLDTLQAYVQANLNYWFQASNLMQTQFVDTPAFETEAINSSPHTCASIFFKSTVIDTPTPFQIAAGTIVLTHFRAKVNTVVGGVRIISLKTQLFYVDADGTSNPVQIGADSDSTTLLTTASLEYQPHIHVSAAVTVPAGKRLWVKFIATTDSGTNDVVLSVEYEDPKSQLSIPVAGSILGNFLARSGGNMTGDITLDGGKTIDGVDVGVAVPANAADLKKREISFFLDGNAYVADDIAYALAGHAKTISLVKIYAVTAPTGASLIVDVNLNGVTIFTTQANRPEIAAGTNADDSGTPDVTAVSAGDRISPCIDQVGSTITGAKVMVTIVFA